MASGGPASFVRDEWDHVWQDYDRRTRRPAPAPVLVPALAVPAEAAAAPAPRRGSRQGALLVVTCCLMLASRTNMHEATGHPSAAEAFASLLSLAPEEAELPPLATAVSRLAVESAAAACWVMRLAPQHQGPAADRPPEGPCAGR